MADNLIESLRADVAADKANPKGPQNAYDSGVSVLYEPKGIAELHQNEAGKAEYRLPAKAQTEPSIEGLAGSKTRPEDYFGSKPQAPPKPNERALTPQEMMAMADEMEQHYVDMTDQALIRGPSVHPALERDSVTEAYVPPTSGYNPPEWLAKYMENVPTTGTTMVDPLGHQRYSQEKERLKKLKALR